MGDDCKNGKKLVVGLKKGLTEIDRRYHIVRVLYKKRSSNVTAINIRECNKRNLYEDDQCLDKYPLLFRDSYKMKNRV